MFSAIFTTIVMFSAVALAAPISYNTTVSYDDVSVTSVVNHYEN